MKRKHPTACLFMLFSPLIFLMAIPMRLKDFCSQLWQSYNWLLDDHFGETVLVLGCSIWLIVFTFVGLGLLYVTH